MSRDIGMFYTIDMMEDGDGQRLTRESVYRSICVCRDIFSCRKLTVKYSKKLSRIQKLFMTNSHV